MDLLAKAELARVILAALVLFVTPLAPWAKVILLWVLDRLDCSPDWWPHRGPLLTKDTKICRSLDYARADKFGDMATYALMLWWSRSLYPQAFPLLLGAFVFRLIGVILFYKTGDRRMFVFFPNFFLTFLLLNSIQLGNLLGVGAHYQVVQEYLMHWDRGSRPSETGA